MKKIIFSALVLTALFNTNAVNAQESKKIAGWHPYGDASASHGWTIEKGVIHLDPKLREGHGVDLVTDKEYENFEMNLEWKISPKGNSGIMLYVHEDPKYKQTYATGLEMQVLDNEGHPDGKITKHRSGDLYDLIKSSSEPVKPVGEWNKVKVVSKNGKLDFTLNGVEIVSTTLWDENFKNLVEGSKFKGWEGFAKYKKGRIALQDHGDEVWYRNISIKELKSN